MSHPRSRKGSRGSARGGSQLLHVGQGAGLNQLAHAVIAERRLEDRLGLLLGRRPVLLLDEIAAHLDVSRRAALFEAIHDLGAQAWLTGTDDSLFAPLNQTAQFHVVANGQISEQANYD